MPACAPQPGRETDLTAAITGTDELVVSVVSASEDASPGAAEDYAVDASGLSLGRFSGYFLEDAIAPATDGTDCGDNCAATPRFQAWADASHDVSLRTWSPGATNVPLDEIAVDFEPPRCIGLPPDPVPNCRLFAVPRDPGICPPELGWFPPDPPLPGDDSSCEVRALEGAPLAACQTDLTCADCEPGYCFTEIPELSQNCSDKGELPFPRVLAGDGPNEPLGFRLVCRPSSGSVGRGDCTWVQCVWR